MASLVKINLSHQFNLFNVSYTCHPLIDLYILEEKSLQFFLKQVTVKSYVPHFTLVCTRKLKEKNFYTSQMIAMKFYIV